MAGTKHTAGTPGPLSVNLTTAPRQYVIKNDPVRLEGEWADIYVEFSGYFGSFGPHLFAAAPDLLAALKACREAMWADNPADGWKEIIDQAAAAIAKAEGSSHA